MIDVPTLVACVLLMVITAMLLYQHFNAMFELQYQLTNDLLKEVKPLIQDKSVSTEYEKDFLYGVSYELSEE
jgi:hypothetical protein